MNEVPTVTHEEMLKRGVGRDELRAWVAGHAHNGAAILRGDANYLDLKSGVTFMELEKLAAQIAAAAVNDERQRGVATAEAFQKMYYREDASQEGGA